MDPQVVDRRQRLLLIANPAARRAGSRLRGSIEGILSRRYDVETLWSVSTSHAREVAAGASASGFSVVAAMGGDGLVSHVLSGAAGSGIGLAIIPAGTTNASARSLGIGVDAKAAAELLATAPAPRAVPVARITVDGARGVSTLYALSQIGVGFDAEVVDRAERNQRRKRSIGELHLAATALAVGSSWPRARNGTLLVESETRSCRASTVSIQVRWPYTFFGRRPVAFTRRAGTGLDTLVVRRVTPTAFLRTAARALASHDFTACPGIQLWPGCLRLTVRADPPMIAQVDGEPLGGIRRMEVAWTLGDLLLANPCGPTATGEIG